MRLPARRLSSLAVSVILAVLASCARPEPLPEGPGLTGVLRGEDGNPLTNVSVMACNARVCYFSDSGADGRFTFPLEEPADYLVKTPEDLRATPRRTTPMVPVAIQDREFVDLGAVYAPSLPAGASIGPSDSGPVWLDAGDGLSLRVDPAALTLAPGDALTDVAARRIRPAMLPAYPALGTEEIVAVYALHPFAAESEAPIQVRVDSQLPSGTPVRFRTIDEIDGRFSEPVAGTADGESLTTAPGSGITRLTHLVVSR